MENPRMRDFTVNGLLDRHAYTNALKEYISHLERKYERINKIVEIYVHPRHWKEGR